MRWQSCISDIWRWQLRTDVYGALLQPKSAGAGDAVTAVLAGLRDVRRGHAAEGEDRQRGSFGEGLEPAPTNRQCLWMAARGSYRRQCGEVRANARGMAQVGCVVAAGTDRLRPGQWALGQGHQLGALELHADAKLQRTFDVAVEQ